MKIFLSICIMAISLQINAQFSYKTERLLNTKIENNYIKIKEDSLPHLNNGVIIQKHKFYFGLISSIDYSYYKWGVPFSTLISTEKDHGYHYGLKLQYNFNEKFSIRSGLSYSNYNYNFTYLYKYTGPPTDPGPTDTSSHIYKYNFKRNFWNQSLMLGYTVCTIGKLKITPSIGLILSEATNTHFGMSSAQLNLGFEYFFNNKLFLTVEPYFNYWLQNDNNEGFISIHNSKTAFGGIFSINYHF